MTPAETLPGVPVPELRALTLVGSNLYWIDSQGTPTASIKSVPTTGGKVTTVLSDPTLDQNMTTDGTLLYFTWTSAADAGQSYKPSELDSVKVDGTSRTSLVTGFSTQNATHTTPASELFLAGGNFYFVAANNTVITNQLTSAPLAGTSSPTLINASAGSAVDLAYADSTGVYVTLESAATPGAFDFSYVPLGGGTVTTLYPGGPLSGYPGAGQVTVVGSTVYFPIDGVGTSAVTFMSATVPPTGAATMLGSTITGAVANGIIGDAQDVYVFSDGTGVYSLNTTTGVPTSVDPNAVNENVSGEIRALDSKNVYFGEAGGGLWAHPR